MKRCIRKAKRDYYTSTCIFNQHKQAARRMWGLLNETLNRNIRKQTIQEFSHNNGTTSDPEVIANTFNEYFINIGGSLAEQIPEAPLFYVYLNNPSETVFSFQSVSEEIVSTIIKK